MNYRPDPAFWASFNVKIERALIKTANSIKLDTEQNQVVPFDNGILQASAFPQVQPSDGNVLLKYSTPYASKQYFDASLRHDKGPHAGTARDHWLDEHCNGGAKEDWTIDKFCKHLSRELGGGTSGSGNNNNSSP